MTNMKFLTIIFTLLVAIAAGECSKPATNRPATNAPAQSGSNQTSTVSPSDSKTPYMTDVPVGNAQTPSEAYRMLFAAVKSQDTSKIRTIMSQGSLGFAETAAGMQKKTVEEVLKNGFSETTFAETLPAMRDERIKGGYGAVEVWNVGRKQWDDIPFVYEGGSWKAAFGDTFGGKWQSPGKSQTIIEQEAANAANPNLVPYSNTNSNIKVPRGKTVPKGK